MLMLSKIVAVGMGYAGNGFEVQSKRDSLHFGNLYEKVFSFVSTTETSKMHLIRECER